MQGISDYELNANGIEQAKKIRDILKKEKFDLIISSPLKRALQTAKIINECMNISIILDNRIKERDYGNLEGEIFKKEYCNLDYDFTSVNGESIENYKMRLNDFIKDIKTRYNSKNILIVAHNGVISVMSFILEGEPSDRNFEKRGIKNGEIKEFTI